jgi:hypothetical protein
VFSSVTISHILKNKNYELCFSAGSFVDQITTKKKVQLSSHWLECLGVPQTGIVSAGSLIKLEPEKKVQSAGHWLQCRIVLAGSSLCFLAGSLIKLQITTGKKVQSSGLLTPFATHVTLYFTMFVLKTKK